MTSDLLAWVLRLTSLRGAEGVYLLILASVAVCVLAALGAAGLALLLRIKNAWRQARWTSVETRWKPLLLSVLAGELEPSTLLAEVRRGEELFFIGFLSRYAWQLAGEELTVLRELARPHLATIAARLAHPQPEQRARAVQTLGLLGAGEYEGQILGALRDPAPLVAMSAARVLAKRGSPELAAAILDVLNRFDTWSESLLVALLTSMREQVVPTLHSFIRNRANDSRVRAMAADALRQLNDLHGGEIAAEVLAQEPDAAPELQRALLELIARVGSATHARVVRPLTISPSAEVRAAALRALGEVGIRYDEFHLRLALLDPSPWVRLHAARGLRALSGDSPLQQIARMDHPANDVAAQVLSEVA